MDFITLIQIIGFIITVFFLWLIAKELKRSIKDSNDGKKNEKCDLD